MIIVHRSQIQAQTISNLVSAGVLLKNEAEHYNELLSAMSMQDLVAALVGSHQIREEQPDSINFYPIGKMSMN